MRNRCCCNCRRRTYKEDGVVRTRPYGEERDLMVWRCKIDGHYIGYSECYDGWCKHWAKERDEVTEE